MPLGPGRALRRRRPARSGRPAPSRRSPGVRSAEGAAEAARRRVGGDRRRIGLARHGRSTAGTSSACSSRRALAQAGGEGPDEPRVVEGENVVRLTVNGEERRGIAEPRTLLSDFLRARAGPDRDARGLRAGRLRRVHCPARRRAGALLPPLRRPGGGREPRDRRGAGDRRRAAPGPAGLSRAARPPVRLLHARSSARDRRPARAQRIDRARPRSATTWRATSAAARATWASSPRCRTLLASSEEDPDGDDRDGGALRRPVGSPRRGREAASAASASSSTTSSCPGCCTRPSYAAPSRTRPSPVSTPSRARELDGRRACAHGRGHRRSRADRHRPSPRRGRAEQPAGAARGEGSLRRRGRRLRRRLVALRRGGRGSADRGRLRAARARRRRGALARGGRAAAARRARSRTTSRTSSTSRETSRRSSPRPTTSSGSDSTTAASMPCRWRAGASSPTGMPARRT